jgi:hypothetical protein
VKQKTPAGWLTFDSSLYILTINNVTEQTYYRDGGGAIMNDRPWLAHYDKGVPHTIEYPQVPLYQLLGNAAKKYPDRACTIFKGAVISYKETGWASSCQMCRSL